VDREAPIVFANAIKKDPLALYGYHTNLYNEVISDCDPHVGVEDLGDTLVPRNSDLAYVNAAIEAEATVATIKKENEEVAQWKQQDAENAKRDEIEKREETKVGGAYYACLSRKAQALALTSNETADVIAEAAIISCPTEREKLADVFNRHNSFLDSEFIDKMDVIFEKNLVLEVVKDRIRQAVPKATPSKKPSSQI